MLASFLKGRDTHGRGNTASKSTGGRTSLQKVAPYLSKHLP